MFSNLTNGIVKTIVTIEMKIFDVYLLINQFIFLTDPLRDRGVNLE